VIHAKEVEDAVKHQDADFGFGRVAVGAGLGASAGVRDGDVAESAERRRDRSLTVAAPICMHVEWI